MKRLPLVASFLLFIALCASLAYWSMQLFKPPLRPVAAPPRTAQPEVRTEAAATLLGGRGANVAVASNYQLRGIIFSGSPRNSVAILSADGKPPQAVRVDTEVAPGVKVTEVHRDYVLLSEGGTSKRVELPESAKGQADLASLAPVPVRPSAPPARPSVAPSQPVPSRAQAAAAAASGAPAYPDPSASPIPQGIVPSIQQPPTAPPRVVVSPPPGAQQSQIADAPSAPPQPVAPMSAAPAGAVPPSQAPVATPGFPVPQPSSDSAPLISR